MKQVIKQGQAIDALTPDEFVRLLPRPVETTRIRAKAQVQLNAAGSGQVEIYKVPAGYSFEARRVFINIGGSSDPSTGNVPLNVAGKFVAYLRSGTLIEYAAPTGPNAVPQVPGVQTWGEEQGPYYRNGEVVEVQALGLTANQWLTVDLEGILFRPSTDPTQGEHPGS